MEGRKEGRWRSLICSISSVGKTEKVLLPFLPERKGVDYEKFREQFLCY